MEINHFRGFEKTFLDFSDANLTVFIGTNGKGKSSLLDLIAIHLNALVVRLHNRPFSSWDGSAFISPKDINNKATATENTITVDTGIYHAGNGKANSSIFSWKTKLNRTERKANLNGEGLLELAKKMREDEQADVPILVYYQSNRTVSGEVTLREKPSRFLLPQFAAYDNAFSKKESDFDDFFLWYRTEEDKENELIIKVEDFRKTNPKLDIIRQAISLFFKHFAGDKYSHLRVERDESKFNEGLRYRRFGASSASLVISKNKEEMNIEQLSDGEKNLILLVCDIARRLAIANPSFKSTADALNGKGIVLVDEIELHLHPSWQKEVLPALRQAFPKLQFIVTTHSPLVLSNLQENEVIFQIVREKSGRLDVLKHQNHRFKPYGAQVSRILSLIMETSERPKGVKDLLERFFQFIDMDDMENAEKVRGQLTQLIDPSDPEIERGDTILEAKRILETV